MKRDKWVDMAIAIMITVAVFLFCWCALGCSSTPASPKVEQTKPQPDEQQAPKPPAKRQPKPMPRNQSGGYSFWSREHDPGIIVAAPGVEPDHFLRPESQPPAAPAPEPPAPKKMVCWDGFGATKDTQSECKGDWIENQEGRQFPAGDGCNTATCMNAACTSMVSTLAACAYHPNRLEIVPVQPENKDGLSHLTSDYSNVFFDPDPHGCRAVFDGNSFGHWNADKQTCEMTLTFLPPAGSVSCSALMDRTIICTYTPAQEGKP